VGTKAGPARAEVTIVEQALRGGTLGRDQLLFKEPKVLLKNGKVQPGTKAHKALNKK